MELLFSIISVLSEVPLTSQTAFSSRRLSTSSLKVWEYGFRELKCPTGNRCYKEVLPFETICCLNKKVFGTGSRMLTDTPQLYAPQIVLP